MGRFETTVEFYDYREPYPSVFFDVVAKRLALRLDAALLDIGCGPGNLAIGFAPFVGNCTAIDPESQMLQAARKAASEAGVNVTFLQTRLEDLPLPNNAFDFVTIGRALHWLDRDTALPLLERILPVGGQLAICGSTGSKSPANEWFESYKRVRNAWSNEDNEARYKIDMDAWFAPSRFRRIDDIRVPYNQKVTIDDLIKRALSFSTSSPAVLREKQQKFEQELCAALEPFARDGELNEELIVIATVFQ